MVIVPAIFDLCRAKAKVPDTYAEKRIVGDGCRAGII
jgi:hypothetical protein